MGKTAMTDVIAAMKANARKVFMGIRGGMMMRGKPPWRKGKIYLKGDIWHDH
jgi:hypothetical protein